MLLPADVAGTASVLRPERWHLSPAIGLALSGSGSHLLSRLYELEPIALSDGIKLTDGTVWHGTPSCRLARALFYRVQPDEPLRPTANRSLPTAHLSSSLAAHVLGLAEANLGSDRATHEALRAAVCSETGLTLTAVARETGVSIARFERLVEAVREADAEPCGGGPAAALPRRGTAMVLRHMWQRASPRGKSALWPYLRVLHCHYGPALTDEALALPGWAEALSREDAPAPADFLSRRLDASHLQSTAALRAVLSVLPSQRTGAGGRATSAADVAAAFEASAAALALSGGGCAPLQELRVSPGHGAPAVADCAELALRELFNALLWSREEQTFMPDRLPASADARLREFYSVAGGAFAPDAAARWMTMVSQLPGVGYLERHPIGPPAAPSSVLLDYEMRPDGASILAATGALLGAPTSTVGALEALWRRCEPSRPLELRREVGSHDRLFVHEGGTLTLELVLSSGRNHAYAIHHAARPAWLRPAAEAALKAWGDETETASNGAQATTGEGCGPAAGRLVAALRPALLQPLLSLTGDELHALAPLSAESARRRDRLLLLCTDPTQPSAVAASVCRLLAPAPRDNKGAQPGPATADVATVARVLRQPLARGGSALSDEQVLRLCDALRPLVAPELGEAGVWPTLRMGGQTQATVAAALQTGGGGAPSGAEKGVGAAVCASVLQRRAARAELRNSLSAIPSLAACLAPSLPRSHTWNALASAFRVSPVTALRLAARGLLRR